MSLVKEYRAFVAVVEHGSIKAAAKSLLSTPPSVSKWLTSLESRVGMQLLERSTHAISVTDLGQDFYLKAREILEKIQQAESMLDHEQSVLSGKLNISLPTVLLKTGFMDLVKSFKRMYPNIYLNLHTSDQFVDFVQQQVHFSLRIGELQDSRLTAISLDSLSMSFYASPDYLTTHPHITYKNLLDEKHIILPTSLSIAGLSKLAEGASRKDLNVKAYYSANDGNTLIEMGKAGLGVVQALDVTVQQDVENGDLVALFPRKRKARIPLYLVFRNHEFMPNHQVVFKEFVKAFLKNHPL